MTDRWNLNKRHWEATLDARNLAAETDATDFEKQVALHDTADIRFALNTMMPLDGARVLDVGGGLALAAVLLARRGARVTIADISLPRLRAARAMLLRLNLADRVDLVVARAEEMPFVDGGFDRIMSKAVMIHTDLDRSLPELHRILTAAGKLLILEPTIGNPFVNLYRKLLAPKVWSHITDYFGEREAAIVLRTTPPDRGVATKPFFLFGFFASVFEFALPSPALYRISETVLCGLDTLLFTVLPPLRRAAWFKVFIIGPR